jgi:hypothetical protein
VKGCIPRGVSLGGIINAPLGIDHTHVTFF